MPAKWQRTSPVGTRYCKQCRCYLPEHLVTRIVLGMPRCDACCARTLPPTPIHTLSPDAPHRRITKANPSPLWKRDRR